MMNLSNLKKVSAFAFGIIAGFAIDKYANAENVSKLKAKASEAYEKLSNKLANATEPNVEYVQEGEVSVDPAFKDDNIKLYCTPEHAADLYDYMSRELKHKKYITIAEIMETNWLDQKTVNHFKDHFTFDECLTYGWNYNTTYWLNRKSGTNYVNASYPEDLTDIIYENEPATDIDCSSIMDTYQKWNENADVLRLTADEQEELTTSREVDAYKVLADIADKMEEDGFVSVATLMQVIYDADKSFYKNMEPFADRFANLNANYDEETLINYGWTSMRYFDVFKIPNIESFMLTSICPHNITSLVEEWTKKNRKEFEEETKAE